MLVITQLQCIVLIHVLCYTCSTACSCRCNRCSIMLRATCNLQIHAFSHDFECTSALCKFCKFCSVLFVPLLFALHCVACAVFALLVDKAGVLHNCKFCSCNKANVFADAKCNYSPGTPTYLVILHFLAQQSGLAPLRTVHSLVLLAAPWVPRLQLNCCIQRHSACLPAILAPNLRHFSSTY